MNDQVAVKFMEQFIEMRRKHHQLIIQLDEIYQLRSTPEGEKFAETGMRKVEELRLDIESMQSSLNMVADHFLHNEQLSYARSKDAEYLDDDDTISSIRSDFYQC